ncbi:MAG TPA: hypothetical protein VH307_17175 [Streptosporangiaceae bacterium]|jgi:hypothetical protein|nr:hypothetical protein [Streptosporangiaceae bacterium]
MTLAQTRQAAASAASAEFRTARARFWQRAAAAWLARRSKTAQAKAARVPIRPGERVLTLDNGPAGSLVAATAAAVYIGGQGEPGGTWCRSGWEEVIRSGWDDRRCVLALTGAGLGGMWRKELALDRHTALVELARERVSATLIGSAVVRHNDRVCSVVMARRLPGSGQVIWVTLLNQADGTGDQAIRAKAAAAIADLRAQAGIPAE